jgi:hypothetical protein
MTAAPAILRRFPLVGRPRPTCSALDVRIAGLTEAADHLGSETRDRSAAASGVLNRAALILSDIGLHDQARDLCWQQIDIYRQAGTRLGPTDVGRMLAPLLNITRLDLRTGDTATARATLDDVYRATIEREDLVLSGRLLPLAHLPGGTREYLELRRWAWLACITEGLRARALDGDWTDGLAYARTHKAIGNHLMEGRQTRIIADLVTGETAAAASTLDATVVTEPWERQVFACLNALLRPSSRTFDAAELEWRLADRRPDYACYVARLGLAIAEIAALNQHSSMARTIAAQTAVAAAESGDGYAAREVVAWQLRQPTTLPIVPDTLRQLVHDAGLGRRCLESNLADELHAAVRRAVDSLCALMSAC